MVQTKSKEKERISVKTEKGEDHGIQVYECKF